jgi:hypothetical protein
MTMATKCRPQTWWLLDTVKNTHVLWFALLNDRAAHADHANHATCAHRVVHPSVARPRSSGVRDEAALQECRRLAPSACDWLACQVINVIATPRAQAFHGYTLYGQLPLSTRIQTSNRNLRATVSLL